MTAIVFPGQGSQYVNMSMDFVENFDIALRVFEEIEDITKINIRKIINENPNNDLNQTIFTQISIFASSLAIYKTLAKEINNELIKPSFFLGHSLGEYTALVASKILNIADASILIKKRSELMNSAIQPNKSGMAAIIGKNAFSVDKIIKDNELDIQIANDNSPMQVVVSGIIEKINNSQNIFLNNGVKKYVKLNVSAAFHSKFMDDAQNNLINEINKIKFNDTNQSIISNYDACINNNIDLIKNALKKQMANMVRWTESIKILEETNTKKIIEIGPGKVLSGLISRISKKFDIISVNKVEDLNQFK